MEQARPRRLLAVNKDLNDSSAGPLEKCRGGGRWTIVEVGAGQAVYGDASGDLISQVNRT